MNQRPAGPMHEPLESRTYFSNNPPVFPPTGLAATTLSSTTIRLTWADNSVNETGFMIFRSTDQVHFTKVITTGPGDVSWTNTDLLPATTYFYKIKARAIPANSTYSNTSSATTLTTASDTFAQLDFNTGFLTVNGTIGDDVISLFLTNNGTIIDVDMNGATRAFNKTDVTRIKIMGLTGDDLISVSSGVGSTYISGGEGNDTLFGGDGNDSIDGDAGDDLIKGRAGDDVLTGGDGNDTIYGQAGNDYLEGDAGNDKLVGGDGNDRILGNDGNDSLYGQGGLDTLLGGGGKNHIEQD